MDEHRVVYLSELSDDQLQQLAVLHRSVMHTLLSDLGLAIALKYYRAGRSDLSVVGMCLTGVSNEIIGWAMGSPDPAALNANVRRPLPLFMLQMLRIALTQPRVFGQLVASVLSSSTDMQLSANTIELTYIGVSASHQGQGLGRLLLNRFIEESRAKGYHSVVLSVEAENKTAIALYESSGFRIIRTFTEGHYQRHRMEVTLA